MSKEGLKERLEKADAWQRNEMINFFRGKNYAESQDVIRDLFGSSSAVYKFFPEDDILKYYAGKFKPNEKEKIFRAELSPEITDNELNILQERHQKFHVLNDYLFMLLKHRKKKRILLKAESTNIYHDHMDFFNSYFCDFEKEWQVLGGGSIDFKFKDEKIIIEGFAGSWFLYSGIQESNPIVVKQCLENYIKNNEALKTKNAEIKVKTNQDTEIEKLRIIANLDNNE